MTMTLGEFQRRYGVHKGTVSKKARELGFDTSAGLSSEAVEAMRREFQVVEPRSREDGRGTGRVVPEVVVEVDTAGALAHYGGAGLVAPGGVTGSGRFMTLGEASINQRRATREERRLAVVEGFNGLSLTREERRLMIQRAAMEDAHDDAETYAAVYQANLDALLQRHAVATGVVLGKAVSAAAGGGQ
jgi:hypothetical protein